MLTNNIVALIFIGVAFRCREIDARPQQTKPGCWYEGKRYQETQVVDTSEPCLRCRCNEGSLRCRLRVCPRLPSPLPSGCITRTPRDNVCCAQLVCGDSRCLHEGVIYAQGSAMMGSRRCEYCYCISGSRRCLRPRCLLPLAGCTPLYAPYSCCPIAYNCTNSAHHTTPNISSSSSSRNGCRVDNRSYDEGEMVRDIAWKGSCDNCFCAMGGVRCVPLACSPPLQGCTPIVREGHCCPSTYNCSGTIEVKATQNYASYAFISKDYAKFRKETNFFPMNLDEEETYGSTEKFTVEGRGHKSAERSPTSDSANLTETKSTNNTENCIDRQSWKVQETTTTLVTIISSHETEAMNNEIPTETMNNEIPTETMDYGKLSTLQEETTFGNGWTTIVPTDISTNTESNTNFDAYSTEHSTLNSGESTDSTNSIIPFDDFPQSSLTVSESSTVGLLKEESTTNRNTTKDLSTIPKVEIAEQNDNKDKAENNAYHVEETVVSVERPATGSPTTILMPDDILVINVTLKTNVSVGHVQGSTISPVRSIAPDIEAIPNVTPRKKGEDYEYDYSQPTLPPSLPNVRIIPFVAADALGEADKGMASEVTNYPLGSVGVPPEKLGATVTGTIENFYDIVTPGNRFSPPIKTEGGFVPREPPYLDPTYQSTDLNLEVRTGVTVLPADMTIPHIKNTELATNCMFENREYRHGELVPGSGHCIICICYYGKLACSDAKCSPLKIGCRRIENEKACCGKIVCEDPDRGRNVRRSFFINTAKKRSNNRPFRSRNNTKKQFLNENRLDLFPVDAEESPTLVLDRADAVSSSPQQPMPSIGGTSTPDPFRDVIKTEPAPDLPSLIEDMIPYLAEHRITTPSATTKLMMDSSTLAQSNSQQHNHIPVRWNVENIYLINEPESKKSSLLNGTLSKTINRTVEMENHKSWSAGISSMKDRLQVTTPKTSALPTRLKMSSSSVERAPIDDDSSIFSFEKVFDILLDENGQAVSTTPAQAKNVEEIKYVEIEESSTLRGSSKISDNYDETIDTIPTTTATSVSSANSLLKLAGCNIYGRMYRVGKIITELSSPCLECRCTEIGVQCKQVEC